MGNPHPSEPANLDQCQEPLPTLSLIMPVLNDPEGLQQILAQVSQIAEIHEIIVADASPDDGCARVAEGFGVRHVRCPRPSRGAQLNAGAAVATGELLLFHHVDVPLTPEHCRAARLAGSQPGFSSAAFYRKFDPIHHRRRWLERLVRAYNRWGGALYGDQSLCIRRCDFEKHGGFADIPLMEDVEFTRRLRRNGGIELLDPPVVPSARRHARRGSLRTTLLNLWILTAFYLGVRPDTLYRWYYGTRTR
ncbi:MAG: TIGR04283 family arsenosugar biosynthesis glycosyltransferase [Phycisphaerales bacterium]|nr:TIGR04283 family arsenosugar biosynthesis glycosyltransferase [Phycisphaerales bacterium]